MEKLTYQQARVLEAIKQHIRETGYPPTVRELGKKLGVKSTATIHSHIRTLERKGYLVKAAQKSRAYTVIGEDVREQYPPTVMVPIVGRVRAGKPVLAVENIEEFVPLPRSFVRSENVFMLQVEGDSMIGAGIHDGDYVLVRQQDTAENGDIVVALIDDEATVKTFYREDGAIRLQPENPQMKPIIAKDVKILGKVIGLYRFFH